MKGIMTNSIRILKMYPESFRANQYSSKTFRMIGLIDVSIQYAYGIERVTLPYYRSSGTYLGKIKGLWYPIVGIKTHSGSFTEFTDYINFVLTHSATMGRANKGWLAKSLFFAHRHGETSKLRGFSNGVHNGVLQKIGKNLRHYYINENFYKMDLLDATRLNRIITSKEIFFYNSHTQRENFENLIEDIYNGDFGN